jgi:D-3-phosphoglycerate dehydrogenase
MEKPSPIPHILVADPIALSGIRLLQAHPAIAVTVQTDLSPDTLRAAIAPYAGVIVRSTTQLTAAVLAAAPSLKVIARAGIGVDNIDVAAATRRGIVVLNTPFGNANAAAEHTLALLLALARHLPQAVTAVKAGQWERQAFLGDELSGTTLGVIGLGRIGRLVVQKARALGMQPVACDPFVTPEVAQALGVELLALPAVLQRADYLSLHVPKTAATHHLLSREAFARMRPGIRIVNCARGGLIDEAALYDALQDGMVAGAALDVLAQEPPRPEYPLLRLPNVICTPHLGAQTRQAQERVALEIAQQMVDFFVHGRVSNAVNGVVLQSTS